ncbi:MAG: hypothetical protein HN350_06210 [Phycisphaerales bacterium]|jgi:hypothetical protein|nr:hypothetical protein [Phycisphaerales bacterium]
MKTLIVIIAALASMPLVAQCADNQIWIGPKAMAAEKGWTYQGPKSDFLTTVTKKENWPQVLENTHVFKTYRNILTKDRYEGKERLRYTDAQLKELIAFIKAHKLKTAIEVGGLRFSARNDGKGMGKAYALSREIPALKRWEQLGGTIDYISTDNMYGLYHKSKHRHEQKNKNSARLTPVDMSAFIDQAVASLKEIQSAFPRAKLGIIECPGYFGFRFDNGKKASPAQKYLPPIYFKDYMKAFLLQCKEQRVVIEHFHFDYPIQGLIRDANLLHGKTLTLQKMPQPADLSLERVRQINKFFRDRGVATGICISPGAYGNKAFSDSPDSDAARAIKTVFSAFADSRIKMDHILFQHWHKFPTRNGPEDKKETFMYNVLQIMNFSKDRRI